MYVDDSCSALVVHRQGLIVVFSCDKLDLNPLILKEQKFEQNMFLPVCIYYIFF